MQILGRVDHAHAALAQGLHHPEAADLDRRIGLVEQLRFEAAIHRLVREVALVGPELFEVGPGVLLLRVHGRGSVSEARVRQPAGFAARAPW
ncbi:hypothetical protein [Nannocystis pusilla]|uniref:hypothetical protein n=1 Tax=Nannocystis pusilla TaxID=889268 RepID=UPI003B81E1AC